MFNFVKIEFPDAPSSQQPTFVYSVRYIQNRASHEMVEVMFRDWDIPYENIAPNSLVKMTIYNPLKKKDFYGYVKRIKTEKSPGKNFVKATLIGASYPMQQPRQKVYRNVTADQVVREIAKYHKFYCYTEPHPRVYQQLSQAGESDWQLMTRIAKQCGYELRTENTELYFVPTLWDYTKYRSEAPRFSMGSLGNIDGTSIYDFELVAGESTEYDDAKKSAVAVGGLDPKLKTPVIVTEQKRKRKTRAKQKQEVFDAFDTLSVVPGVDIAKYEAEAAEIRNNAFPYRAVATVIGDPTLRPNMPVYLDGIGETYSGYWTILSLEHNVEEEELNRHKFTTTIYVGTDSLGSATTWTDNALITAPNYRPKRTIIANVRQTVVVPETVKSVTSRRATPQTEQLFGQVTNRNRSTGNRLVEAPVWISATPNQSTAISKPKTSPVIVKRKLNRGAA